MSTRILVIPVLLLVQTACGLCGTIPYDWSRTGGGEARVTFEEADASQAFEVPGSSFDNIYDESLSDRAVFDHDEVNQTGTLWITRTGDDLTLCGVPVRDVYITLYWWGDESPQADVWTDSMDAVFYDQDFVVVGEPPAMGTAGSATFRAQCPDQTTLEIAIDRELDPFVSVHTSGETEYCNALFTAY